MQSTHFCPLIYAFLGRMNISALWLLYSLSIVQLLFLHICNRYFKYNALCSITGFYRKLISMQSAYCCPAIYAYHQWVISRQYTLQQPGCYIVCPLFSCYFCIFLKNGPHRILYLLLSCHIGASPVGMLKTIYILQTCSLSIVILSFICF